MISKLYQHAINMILELDQKVISKNNIFFIRIMTTTSTIIAIVSVSDIPIALCITLNTCAYHLCCSSAPTAFAQAFGLQTAVDWQLVRSNGISIE